MNSYRVHYNRVIYDFNNSLVPFFSSHDIPIFKEDNADIIELNRLKQIPICRLLEQNANDEYTVELITFEKKSDSFDNDSINNYSSDNDSIDNYSSNYESDLDSDYDSDCDCSSSSFFNNDITNDINVDENNSGSFFNNNNNTNNNVGIVPHDIEPRYLGYLHADHIFKNDSELLEFHNN